MNLNTPNRRKLTKLNTEIEQLEKVTDCYYGVMKALLKQVHNYSIPYGMGISIGILRKEKG